MTTTSALLETLDLEAIDLFQSLTREARSAVLHHGQTKKIKHDEFLFFEGDPATTIYVLLAGSIKLFRTTVDGEQVIMRYVGPGDAFAVIAVLSAIDYPVTAQTVKSGEVVAWPQDVMTRLMHEQPQIALNSIRILSERVREFQGRIQELTTERMERRIARALLRLAAQSGRKADEGVVIDLRITRQDLAELTGSSMYSVSRTLSHWESLELIRCTRERITIRAPHSLVQIAEDHP